MQDDEEAQASSRCSQKDLAGPVSLSCSLHEPTQSDAECVSRRARKSSQGDSNTNQAARRNRLATFDHREQLPGGSSYFAMRPCGRSGESVSVGQEERDSPRQNSSTNIEARLPSPTSSVSPATSSDGGTKLGEWPSTSVGDSLLPREVGETLRSRKTAFSGGPCRRSSAVPVVELTPSQRSHSATTVDSQDTDTACNGPQKETPRLPEQESSPSQGGTPVHEVVESFAPVPSRTVEKSRLCEVVIQASHSWEGTAPGFCSSGVVGPSRWHWRGAKAQPSAGRGQQEAKNEEVLTAVETRCQPASLSVNAAERQQGERCVARRTSFSATSVASGSSVSAREECLPQKRFSRAACMASPPEASDHGRRPSAPRGGGPGSLRLLLTSCLWMPPFWARNPAGDRLSSGSSGARSREGSSSTGPVSRPGFRDVDSGSRSARLRPGNSWRSPEAALAPTDEVNLHRPPDEAPSRTDANGGMYTPLGYEKEEAQAEKYHDGVTSYQPGGRDVRFLSGTEGTGRGVAGLAGRPQHAKNPGRRSVSMTEPLVGTHNSRRDGNSRHTAAAVAREEPFSGASRSWQPQEGAPEGVEGSEINHMARASHRGGDRTTCLGGKRIRDLVVRCGTIACVLPDEEEEDEESSECSGSRPGVFPSPRFSPDDQPSLPEAARAALLQRWSDGAVDLGEKRAWAMYDQAKMSGHILERTVSEKNPEKHTRQIR